MLACNYKDRIWPNHMITLLDMVWQLELISI